MRAKSTVQATPPHLHIVHLRAEVFELSGHALAEFAIATARRAEDHAVDPAQHGGDAHGGPPSFLGQQLIAAAQMCHMSAARLGGRTP